MAIRDLELRRGIIEAGDSRQVSPPSLVRWTTNRPSTGSLSMTPCSPSGQKAMQS